MKKTRISLVVCVILAIASMFSLCSSKIIIIPSQPQFVIVDFEFDFVDLAGQWTNELYSGGWFSYNITIKNIGNLDLNATYTVTVYNPDNTVKGYRDFTLNLKPFQSGCLYPNQTFNIPTGLQMDNSSYRTIFFADTSGAYKVNVTANTPITYLRLANDNVTYNTIFDYYQIAFDAMPSYQEKVNQDTTYFYQKNNAYFESFNKFVDASLLAASNTEKLTVASIGVSVVAVLISIYSIAKDERWNRYSFMFLIILAGITALMVNYIYPEYGWIASVLFFIYGLFIIAIFRFNQIKKLKREQQTRLREQQREQERQQQEREIEERLRNTV